MKGASAKADRATRPTDQAPAGLGDTASVPSADLLALAERCEKATGEFDPVLCSALHDVAQPGYIQPANYCASIDAAMTLVPEGWSVRLITHSDEAWADVYLLGDEIKRYGLTLDRPIIQQVESERCVTPALALCAAALRARASR